MYRDPRNPCAHSLRRRSAEERAPEACNRKVTGGACRRRSAHEIARSMNAPRRRPALALLCLTLACASTPSEPAPDCTTRPGEASLEIHCDPHSTEWSDEATREAAEDMERRAPGGRR